jgi:hypothetical protein
MACARAGFAVNVDSAGIDVGGERSEHVVGPAAAGALDADDSGVEGGAVVQTVGLVRQTLCCE